MNASLHFVLTAQLQTDCTAILCSDTKIRNHKHLLKGD